MEPEILVNVTFRIPQADREVLGRYLTPLFQEAVKVGGDTVHVSMQPYTPDDD